MGEVRDLFSQLQVRRGNSGNIVIEAPPEAASTLSALSKAWLAATVRITAGGLTAVPFEESGDA